MRHIEYSSDAKSKLLDGVKKIARAVKVTLGPSGRNVLIRNKGEARPFSTKDGVTVAGNMSSEDPYEMIAIESIQDVASLSNEAAGDGTTTATILAESIFEGGLSISNEYNLIDIKRGIDLAVANIVKFLRDNSLDCSDNDNLLRQVALIACNYDDEIADIVLDAFKTAGRQGVVNIKRSRTHTTYLSTIAGMNLPMGYMSVYYNTDYANEICNYENTIVYMTDSKIKKMTPNLEYLLTTVSDNQDSLLIICDDMDVIVSDILIKNKSNGSLKVCVCKAPGFGQERIDMLKDLATVLGKEAFIKNEGVSFDDLPQSELLDRLPICEEVIITAQQSSFKGAVTESEEEKDAIKKAMIERADSIREKLHDHVSSYEKNLLQTRISRLSDGLAYINIGAYSDTEFIDKQHRVQDALHAIKGANSDGVVPGGGSALIHIGLTDKLRHKNPSINAGIRLVYNAIQAPFFQIMENAGIELLESDLRHMSELFLAGIDARDGERTEDMIAKGVIDPVKTICSALENASSIAGLMLTTECVIIDDEVYSKETRHSIF